jgi:hypothetical protein
MMEQQGQTGGNQGTPSTSPPGDLSRSSHPLATLFGRPPSAEYPDARRKPGAGMKVFGIVLLGILAAGLGYVALSGVSLLLPRSAEARAADMARSPRAVSDATTLVETLQTQLMLYKFQHNDRLPTLAELQNDWGVLARKTYGNGSLVEGDQPPGRRAVYGPYLKEVPVNPLTNSSRVAAAGKATDQDGFTYDARTGKVWAVATVDTEQVRRARGVFEVVK